MFQYEKASTVLSVASIRQQFSLQANILMSLYSANFLRRVSTHLHVEGEEPPDIQFQEKGYLFLASQEGEQTLRENHSLQRSLGAEVELIGPQQLRESYPWISTEGVKLACLGMFEGVHIIQDFSKTSKNKGRFGTCHHVRSGEVVLFSEGPLL